MKYVIIKWPILQWRDIPCMMRTFILSGYDFKLVGSNVESHSEKRLRGSVLYLVAPCSSSILHALTVSLLWFFLRFYHLCMPKMMLVWQSGPCMQLVQPNVQLTNKKESKSDWWSSSECQMTLKYVTGLPDKSSGLDLHAYRGVPLPMKDEALP